MIADHRVVIVLRAEKHAQTQTAREGGREPRSRPTTTPEPATPTRSRRTSKKPEPTTVLAFVAADVDSTRRLYKQLVKSATIVECWGLKGRRTRGPTRGRSRARQKSW